MKQKCVDMPQVKVSCCLAFGMGNKLIILKTDFGSVSYTSMSLLSNVAIYNIAVKYQSLKFKTFDGTGYSQTPLC